MKLFVYKSPTPLLPALSAVSLGSFQGLGSFMNTTTLSDATGAGAGGLFERLISSVLNFLVALAGLAFLLYFVLGAIAWITSGGDTQKVENAKNQMTSAAIGLIAVVAAYTIGGIISLVLGIDILNPATVIPTLSP